MVTPSGKVMRVRDWVSTMSFEELRTRGSQPMGCAVMSAHTRDIDATIEEYVAAAIAQCEAVESGKSREANRAFDRVMKTFRALTRRGFERSGEFRALLQHEAPAVRYWAAAQFYEPSDAALAVLSDLTRLPGMLGFRAEKTLASRRAGTLAIF